MQSLLTRLRSLSESPANFIVIVRDEAKALADVVEAAKEVCRRYLLQTDKIESIGVLVLEDALAKLEVSE